MSSPQDYPLFVHWMKTTDYLLDRCEKMPRHVRYSLVNRIANLTLDIQQGIIEAIYTKERKAILEKVNLWLEQLRVLLRICFTRKYLSYRQFEFISSELLTAGKMIGGWKK